MDSLDFRFDFGPIIAVIVLLGLVGLGFTIWMIVDAARRPEEAFSSPGAKSGWLAGMIVGLLFGAVGFVVAVVYFFMVRAPGMSAAHAIPPGAAPPPPTGAAPAYCPSCGAKQVAGARFCHSCGAPTGAVGA